MKRPISTRGRKFTGKVISDKMSKTVTVEWNRRVLNPKYERYEKKRSRVKAHNPDNIGAKKGDIVTIMETRPISKTKHFIVTEIIGKANEQDIEIYEVQENVSKKEKKKADKK